MPISGRVVLVTTDFAGDTLLGDHTEGAVSITVVNSVDFALEGGTIILRDDAGDGGNGLEQTIDYVSVDQVTNVITLDGLLDHDFVDGTEVVIEPASPITKAYVKTDDVLEPLPAVVPQDKRRAYIDEFEDGPKPEGTGVVVVVEDIRETMTVTEVVDTEVSFDARQLSGGPVPTPLLTDGLPPVDAPVPVASPFAIAGVQADWAPITNPDPVTYLVHASLTSPVPEDGSALVYETKSTLARVTQIGGVAFEAGTATEVFMKIQSSDGDGLGPFSTEVSATTLTADGFITAEWIAAITISAQQIITGKFSAGQGVFGDFIEVDGDTSSITIYGDSDHLVPLIQLRPEGSVFRGQVIADDISVLNGLILQGVLSTIAQNSGVTLANGVASPTLPPVLTPVTSQAAWPAVPSGFVERGIFWDSTASRWLRLLVPTSGSKVGACKVQRITAAGVFSSEITLANVSSGVAETDFNSICRIGSSYYSAVYDSGTSSWIPVKWSTSGVLEVVGAVSWGSGDTARPAVGVMGSSLLMAVAYTLLSVVEFDAATLGAIGTITNGDIDWTGRSNNLTYVALESFDFGTDRLVYAEGANVYSAEDIAGTYTEQADEGFTLPATSFPGGVAWGGVHFFSTHGASSLHKYTEYYPATSEKAYVDHADTGSGDITLPSPVANVEIPARRWLQVALPPGGATSADVFMGLGTSAPADSAMLKRAETLTGRNMLIDPSDTGSGTHSSLRTLTSVTRSGTVATGTTSAAHGYAVGDEIQVKGAAAPLSGVFVVATVPDTTHFTYAVPNSGSTSSSGTVLGNTFGAGSPGWIKSAATPGWEGKGDGTLTQSRVPTAGSDVVNKDYVDKFTPKIVTSRLAADTALLTASKYTSIKPNTAVEDTSDATDLTLTWSGDIFKVSENGWYEINWHVTFSNDVTTGNRLVGLLKNFTATTLNSATVPGTAYRLRWAKVASSSDTTTAQVLWKGYLTTTDEIMCFARATVAVKVMGNVEETSLTVTRVRAA